jgi:hypothetical protein
MIFQSSVIMRYCGMAGNVRRNRSQSDRWRIERVNCIYRPVIMRTFLFHVFIMSNYPEPEQTILKYLAAANIVNDLVCV